MSGGVGSRLWPRSRKSMPKQLINLLGDNSMIRETVERISGLIDYSNILIVTNKVQKALIEEQIPEIPSHNIIAEPVGKNTAPCVALSARIIELISDVESSMAVLPADHLIKTENEFLEDLEKAFIFAENNDCLVTFGIVPSKPETGYGYINFDESSEINSVFKVSRFVEKPDLEKAKEYISAGNYLWNSGMFVWSLRSIKTELNKYMPETFEKIFAINSIPNQAAFSQQLSEAYNSVKSISIDYGIMEMSEKVFVIKSKFNWNDVGSWNSVYELSKKDENKNSIRGNVFVKDTNNSLIFSEGKFSAVLGVDNLIIVNTEDALLVCRTDLSQDVKNVVEFLNDNNLEELL